MNYGGAGSSTSAGDEIALRALGRRSDRSRLVVFDVGANVGSYASQALKTLGERVTVYAFEPSPTAFAQLERRFASSSSVHLARLGVGANAGTATLWAAVPGSVLASTYTNPINGDVPGEPIELATIDAFCADHTIERIDLLKLDVEGGELDALRGAQRMLRSGAIDMIQFEFGQPSIGARTFFVDLYELLAADFSLYRVLPNGLEPLTAYHETLEVFMSTNYLAVSKHSREH